MSFLSAVIDKAKKLLDQGDLVTDLGTLPMNDSDRKVSLSIRQYPGKPPHLLFVKEVRTHPGIETESFQIACSLKRAEYLEKVAREIKRQINASAA
jgi:hypothetical protein